MCYYNGVGLVPMLSPWWVAIRGGQSGRWGRRQEDGPAQHALHLSHLSPTPNSPRVRGKAQNLHNSEESGTRIPPSSQPPGTK